MSFDLTRTCAITACAFVILANPSQAACDRDLNGTWRIKQSNILNSGIEFTIKQTGTDLRGKAIYTSSSSDGHVATQLGPLDGALANGKFKIKIFWDNGIHGIYLGTVSAQGRLEGTTYAAANKASQATWYSTKRFNCVTEAAVEPAAVPPKALGKVKVEPVTLSNPMEICIYARSARKRGSPAAPGLERQCREAGGTP